MSGVIVEPEYRAARHVLLEALEALGPHRSAVVLVGAQAVYLRAGEVELAVAPYTTDADLALDPRQLGDEPVIATALEGAGFELAVRPGTWRLQSTEQQVDLLVPSALGGPGRRGARLGVHGTEVARKANGLEAAVVDHEPVVVSSMDPEDGRSHEVKVAGVAALLVAKLHKINERRHDPARLNNKDALDVLRLLRCEEPARVAATLDHLASDAMAGEVTVAAHAMLAELFGSRDAVGSRMASGATAGLEDELTIAVSCEVLARELLQHWQVKK